MWFLNTLGMYPMEGYLRFGIRLIFESSLLYIRRVIFLLLSPGIKKKSSERHFLYDLFIHVALFVFVS